MDLIKGLTGGGWAAVYAWTFPGALTLGAFWLLVYPQMSGAFPDGFAKLSAAQQGGIFIAAAAAIGLILNATSTPLYRLLEGYSWPKRLRRFGVRKQLATKKRIEQSLEGEGWESGLKLERLARFPSEDNEIAPSRLGNALRAFETYGSTRFNLDSQTLWGELCTVVPKYLQDELDRSRAGTDFFVALFYLSAAFGLVTLIVGLTEHGKFGIMIWAILSFASMFLWYDMAIVSTSYWKTNVQALVNIGRKKLAEEMGLQMPTSIDDERKMWGLLTSLVFYNDEESAKALDKFRKRNPPQPRGNH
jgi:hypothetical protein